MVSRRLLPPRALPALCLIAIGAFGAPAAADAKSTKSVFPTVTSVTPKKAKIGEQLTLRGKNYLVGKGRTTVVFKRDGKKAVFVKADVSTKTMLKITVPKSLTMLLGTKAGFPIYTKFRLRVGAKRLAKRYTTSSLTPLIGPETATLADAEECVKVRTGADPNGDLDKDLLTNAEELGLTNKLDPCSADSDGDTMTDGWEFYAAKDLNIRAVPYPGKKPFPNALDAGDVNHDYDGDGLRAKQEFDLWNSYGKPSQTMENRDQLLYSDGTKSSSGPGPDQRADLATLQANAGACGNSFAPPSLGYLGTGYVNPSVAVEDDEKDADHDGLGNWAEVNGPFNQEWWTAIYGGEPKYAARAFASLDHVDGDVDGDGCLDGLDDQDADDWPNWTESARTTTWRDGVTDWVAGPNGGWSADGATTGVLEFVAQPFNPCLPLILSRSCSKHPPKGGWAPFTDPYKPTVWDGVTLPQPPDLCMVNVAFRGVAFRGWVWDFVQEQPARTC